MKAYLILLTSILTLNCALAQSKQEQAVLELSKKKFTWLIQKQADSLKAILDERVMFVHSSGWVQSKQEMIDDMLSGKLVYKIIDLKETTVRVYDKTAIITGTGRFSGSGQGNDFSLDLFYTEVYILQGKKWLLASRHANRLP